MFKQFSDLLDVFFSHGVELLSTGERVFGKYSKNILNWEYAECNGNCSRWNDTTSEARIRKAA